MITQFIIIGGLFNAKLILFEGQQLNFLTDILGINRKRTL